MRLLNILNYASKAKLLNKVPKVPLIKESKKTYDLDKVKKANKENKLLFGAVLKKKKTSKVPLKDVKQKLIEVTEEHHRSSEFYWLVQHPNNPKPHLEFEVNAETSVRSNEEVENKLKLNNVSSNTPNMPFTENGIRLIHKFPLTVDDEKSHIEYNDGFEGKLPPVGKILTATMSESARFALINWKISKIKELGEDGFNNLQQENLRKGRELHQALESYLKLQIEPEPEAEVYQTWQSVSPILKELQPKPKLTETFVEHPYLKYKGVVDSVSFVGGNLSVIEWKKSDKMKDTVKKTYDAPIQLAAYLGALNTDPRYKLSIKTGYVCVAYTDGSLASLFEFDEKEMFKYWNLWLRRLQEYWIRTRDGTLPDAI